MSIELKIDYEALAGCLAPLIIEHLQSAKPKADSTRWTKADILKYFGCGETTFYKLSSRATFPLHAGYGRHKTWAKEDIERFWLNLSKS
jgi:predicted DNA-binding transcriptional regulator AlpA